MMMSSLTVEAQAQMQQKIHGIGKHEHAFDPGCLKAHKCNRYVVVCFLLSQRSL